jgi:hypothetical protein
MNMKKLTIYYNLLFLVAALLIGCTNSSADKQAKEVTHTKNEKVPSEDSKSESIEKIAPAKITVKMFFRSRDMSGYEGYEDMKPETSEREEFRKKNKYTFCYDSEEFNNLQLAGTGEKLTLIVKKGNTVIFSKVEFNLKDNITFTTKDFNLEMGASYSISIRQEDKDIFSGVIDSQGCM